MRVTKVILEEQNKNLKEDIEYLKEMNNHLNKEVKLLGGVIAVYSRMPSLIIATEKISDALAQTITRISSKLPKEY